MWTTNIYPPQILNLKFGFTLQNTWPYQNSWHPQHFDPTKYFWHPQKFIVPIESMIPNFFDPKQKVFKLGGRLAGWLNDDIATLWPILQAETFQISSWTEFQDRPSVAIISNKKSKTVFTVCELSSKKVKRQVAQILKVTFNINVCNLMV